MSREACKKDFAVLPRSGTPNSWGGGRGVNTRLRSPFSAPQGHGHLHSVRGEGADVRGEQAGKPAATARPRGVAAAPWKFASDVQFLITHKFQTFHPSQIVLMIGKPNLGIDSRTC